MSRRLVCWQQTQYDEAKIQIKKATFTLRKCRSSAQAKNNQISATKSLLLGVQTWGFETDHILDQVDFTAIFPIKCFYRMTVAGHSFSLLSYDRIVEIEKNLFKCSVALSCDKKIFIGNQAYDITVSEPEILPLCY